MLGAGPWGTGPACFDGGRWHQTLPSFPRSLGPEHLGPKGGTGKGEELWICFPLQASLHTFMRDRWSLRDRWSTFLDKELTCGVAVAQFHEFADEAAFRSWWFIDYARARVSFPWSRQCSLVNPLLGGGRTSYFISTPGRGGGSPVCLGLWGSRERVWWIITGLSLVSWTHPFVTDPANTVQQVLQPQPSWDGEN